MPVHLTRAGMSGCWSLRAAPGGRGGGQRGETHRASIGHRGPLPPAVFLAVPGGGDNGAFGAGFLNGWTVADNAPLWKLVEKEIDQAFLDAVAGEYEKGRLLLAATVDLDARQAVLWNMTKIAASRDPKALGLFGSIMIGMLGTWTEVPMSRTRERNGRVRQPSWSTGRRPRRRPC